ncbi:hypothetical protein K4A83_19155 [Spirulina subsalsa FACHB-351]|uniref:Uncharacterized protein n=1 Tax=Spirulina subsalsa FACHB-351 TaxID=234711 RepID=A0ABT3LA42_9CYAN|nr:hypothetical protein [Spirulina subsalsa]MCW6038375.1 hypothetical protein [Spirulina subsalsa FACHB-351]
MSISLQETPTYIEEFVNHILTTRRITRQDQSRLMSLLFDNVLGDQEQRVVNRIFDALHQGTVRVVD